MWSMIVVSVVCLFICSWTNYFPGLVFVTWPLEPWQLAHSRLEWEICVLSQPMKITTSSTKAKGLWNSRPWNLCRLTQVRLIFIFSSPHQGSCFWRSWQLMWLMEPLLIAFVSPLCPRFRRSQCPNSHDAHQSWRNLLSTPAKQSFSKKRNKPKQKILAALCLCVSLTLSSSCLENCQSAPPAEASTYSFSLRGRLIRYVAHLWFSCMYVFIQLFYCIRLDESCQPDKSKTFSYFCWLLCVNFTIPCITAAAQGVHLCGSESEVYDFRCSEWVGHTKKNPPTYPPHPLDLVIINISKPFHQSQATGHYFQWCLHFAEFYTFCHFTSTEL